MPFAPAGAREAIAVVPGAESLPELGAEQTHALSAGLSKVLGWYEEEGLSAFNFTVFGGALDGRETGFPVVLRVIARTAFKQDYRTDDYFLQKQLGGELLFAAPEEMGAAAGALRRLTEGSLTPVRAAAEPACPERGNVRYYVVPARPGPRGALAQLGERHTGSVEVSGSIPLCSTIFFRPLESRRGSRTALRPFPSDPASTSRRRRD